MKFSIQAKVPGTLARAGTIETPHGSIETPAFIPVGTKATVKALSMEQVHDLGAQAVLSNAYHLYLQPGTKILEQAGGLGKFMNWKGPTFTDSGGFQAFSLQGAQKNHRSKFSKGDSQNENEQNEDGVEMAKVDDDGVTFKSVIDGSTHRFTPEISMDIQRSIGADIIFAFDECAEPSADYEAQKKAVERTRLWAERCLLYIKNQKSKIKNYDQALFGIVQGGRHEDLRRQSACDIGAMDFDGFGIGGTFEKADMATAVGWVCAELPEDKPRHLLGIGEPSDLILGIENGADTFDCVAPTRLGRNGAVYIKGGRLNMNNAQFENDFTPIASDCDCYTCKNFTRAYVAHLFRAKEMFAGTLASIHNLYFLVNLVKRARVAIIEGKWEEFKKSYLAAN